MREEQEQEDGASSEQNRTEPSRGNDNQKHPAGKIEPFSADNVIVTYTPPTIQSRRRLTIGKGGSSSYPWTNTGWRMVITVYS